MDTFLEFLSCSERAKCGYCKNERGERHETSVKKEEGEGAGGSENVEEREKLPDSSVTTGLSIFQMSIDHLQQLESAGWSTSGRYLYKPHNELTCCPQYTIRLDVTKFKMSRTQKRVMRQMNEYLETGKRPRQGGDEEEQTTSTASRAPEASSGTTSSKREPKEKEPVKPKKVKDADRPVLTKKEIRNARFEEKCLKRNLDPEAVRAERRRKDAARQRTIQSYLDEHRPDWQHKLEIRLVPVGSEEFAARDNESFELYKKYQEKVHNDQCRLAGFRRFLCDSPLRRERRDGVDLGSFHLWFILDDKLLAVCVVDILSKCLSAKYMYYDPDYSFLSMGTYTALREINETMRFQQISAELKYYYMGYYIHSCPKMRYKAKFHPSDLLCEHTFKWLPVDECVPLLDASTARNGFAVFRPDLPRPAPRSMNDLLVLSNRCITNLGRLLEAHPEFAENQVFIQKASTLASIIGPETRGTVFFFSELQREEEE